MTVRNWGVFALHHGDCLDVLRGMADDSVDSVVTDPPYGLAFMGKRWDYDVPKAEVWSECLRVLKPGGHMLAFGGTRTYHRLVCTIEDAGFEVRDTLMWVFGSGFPKSHNGPWGGTALKPAWEPICMARKPLIGTVEANWREHGVGALNIDGCRVGGEPSPSVARRKSGAPDLTASMYRSASHAHDTARYEEQRPGEALGRWPANLIHDGSDEVLAAFPQAPGQLADVSETAPSAKTGRVYGAMARAGEPSQDSDNDVAVGFKMKPGARRLDSGSAARFFMTCKDDACDPASTVGSPSRPQSQFDASALERAVCAALPEGLSLGELPSELHSTSATPSQLRLASEVFIETIQTFDARFWHERQPAGLSLSLSRANVAVDRAQTGITTITASLSQSAGNAGLATFTITLTNSGVGARGCAPSTASRLIYCAKTSRKDRNEGCEGLPQRVIGTWGGDDDDLSPGKKSTVPKGNTHPTVKPTDLMRYLCRLVTPAGGVVLDPFTGSGSTGKAAVLEGFRFVGIEREDAYVDLAERRIATAVFGPCAFGEAA